MRFDFTSPEALVLPDQPLHLDALVDAVVMAAMERFEGNKTKAAEYLGISRFALHRKLQQKNDKKVDADP